MTYDADLADRLNKAGGAFLKLAPKGADDMRLLLLGLTHDALKPQELKTAADYGKALDSLVGVLRTVIQHLKTADVEKRPWPGGAHTIWQYRHEPGTKFYCDAWYAEEALMDPEDWRRDRYGMRWLESEYAEARRQRDGTSTGLLYGGDRSLGEKRESEAHRLMAMPLEELVNHCGSQHLALSYATQAGLPVSHKAYLLYTRRGKRPVPESWFEGYTRVGDRMERWHVT